jgi:hypothetical protein
MKCFLFVITLFFFIPLKAQCVKLFVDEHLSGSPICNLVSGDYIEICEDWNEVTGCPKYLYIYKKGSNLGTNTYYLSLDKGWSTYYAKLSVNPSTKLFGFEIQGQTGVYSYYTESELSKINEQKEKLKEAQIKTDRQRYTALDQLIKSDDYTEAKKILEQLYYPESYPKYWLFKGIEDGVILDKIDSLISRINLNSSDGCVNKESFVEDQNRIKEISNLYNKLNYNSEPLKRKIASKVVNRYSDANFYIIDDYNALDMSDQENLRAILSCVSKGSKLKGGLAHELFVEQNGDVLINDKLVKNCIGKPLLIGNTYDPDFSLTLGFKSSFQIADRKNKKVKSAWWYGTAGFDKLRSFKKKHGLDELANHDSFSFSLKTGKEDTIFTGDIIDMCSYITSGAAVDSYYNRGDSRYNSCPLIVNIEKRTLTYTRVNVLIILPEHLEQYIQKNNSLEEYKYPTIVSEDGSLNPKHRIYFVGDLYE